MRTVVIVQARMTSTRLPGKVLADIGGHSMLAQVIDRLRRMETANEIVVATTTNATDDPLIPIATAADARWFRGDEQDVLGRYSEAAREARADIVVRVTADCPLIFPKVCDRVVRALTNASTGTTDEPLWTDYASNVLFSRTYPRGLDCEALWLDVLLRVNRIARSPAAREHVTWYIREEAPSLFPLQAVCDHENNSDLRWTVDTAEDLEHVRALYAAGGGEMPYRELLALARKINPPPSRGSTRSTR